MEEILIANLTLDTFQRNKIAPLIVPQGDYGARVIRAKITDLGKTVIVESAAEVSIVATRSGDGESQAFSGSVNADGTVTVPVTQWMLDVPEDDVKCHVVVTGSGYQYSTTEFLIEPQEKANPTEISTDDPRVDVVTEVLANENARQAAEAERKANEDARKTAENVRQRAETQRLTDEATRIANEAERVSAEASRDATFKSWVQDIASLPTFDGRISANRKRIENLESRIPAESFIIDDSVAYTKDVPENVAPNAVLTKLGGMTYKDGDTLRSAKVTEVKSVGANHAKFSDKAVSFNGVTITIADSVMNITGTGTASGGRLNRVSDEFMLQAGTYYFGVAFSSFAMDVFISTGSTILAKSNTSFTLAEATTCYISLNTVTDTAYNQEIRVMLAKGSSTLPFAPYTTEAFSIPTDVQNLDSYGLGLNATYHNHVSFEDDMTWKFNRLVKAVDLNALSWSYIAVSNVWSSTDLNGVCVGNVGLSDAYEFVGTTSAQDQADKTLQNRGNIIYLKDTSITDASQITGKLLYALATPTTEDISDLITANNLVTVQSGGTITHVNEYSYAVPSTIIYQLR